MPRRVTDPLTFRAKTKANMQALGTYKPEFDDIILMYADLRALYEHNMCECADIDIQERTPLCITLEKLRADIAKYAEMLGLTPAALKKLNDEKEKQTQSPLEKAINNIQKLQQ